MQLESFGISNFKAFGASLQRMPLKPITLIFGPNSAGKSSLIQSYLWSLHTACHGGLGGRVTSKPHAGFDLGNFQSLLHGQDPSRRITTDFELGDNGGLPIRVSYQLGIVDGRELHRMQENLKRANPTVHRWFELLEVIERSEDQFNRLARWIGFEEGETEKLLESESYCQAKIDEMVNFYRDELGEDPETTTPPTPSEYRQFHKTASEAWEELRELKQTSGAEIEAYWDKVRATLEAEGRSLTLLSCSLIMNDFVYLKANRAPGRNQLEVNFIDPEVHLDLGQLLDSDELLDARRRSVRTAFSGFDLIVPDTPEFESVSEDQVAAALGWIRRSRIMLEQANQAVVHLGPLRHLPGRKELIGSRGEHPDNPALHAWIRLRDEPKLRDQVNRRLKELNSQPYAFAVRALSGVKDLLRARDEMPSGTTGAKLDFSEENWLDARKGDPLFGEKTGQDFDDLWHEDEDLASEKLQDRIIENDPSSLWLDLGIRDLRNQVTVGIRDVGTGLSQIAPVLVHAAGEERKTIVIEQPEIHIHPALQSELADVLIESALGGNENTFLLETHSEHLILRLLRRIRETTEGDFGDWPAGLKQACPNGIRPEDVAVLYVQPGNEGAQIVELPVTPDGDFDGPWPGGFFGERSKELF